MKKECIEDILDPSHKEIRDWAFNDGEWPDTDFDFTVGVLKNADLILELARDPNCPSKYFFLKCLYLIIGECFRSDRDLSIFCNQPYYRDVCAFVDRVDPKADPLVESWLKKSKDLIQNPRHVNYYDWSRGEIAQKEIETFINGPKLERSRVDLFRQYEIDLARTFSDRPIFCRFRELPKPTINRNEMIKELDHTVWEAGCSSYELTGLGERWHSINPKLAPLCLVSLLSKSVMLECGNMETQLADEWCKSLLELFPEPRCFFASSEVSATGQFLDSSSYTFFKNKDTHDLGLGVIDVGMAVCTDCYHGFICVVGED